MFRDFNLTIPVIDLWYEYRDLQLIYIDSALIVTSIKSLIILTTCLEIKGFSQLTIKC